MCKVPKGDKKYGYNWRMETIQIGAVILDDNYCIVDEFNTYIRLEYGRVDGFIESFSGIRQADVVNASSFKTALKSFLDWLPADDVRCVSWSDSDPIQLVHEYKEKGIDDERFEIIIANWIDCQEIFGRKMSKENPYSLEEALIAADIIPEGKAHDSFYDAYKIQRYYFQNLIKTQILSLMPFIKRQEKKPNISAFIWGIYSLSWHLRKEQRWLYERKNEGKVRRNQSVDQKK